MKLLLVKLYGEADEIVSSISLGMLATQIRGRTLDALKEERGTQSVADLVASTI